MFQPVPAPVASPTSNAWDAVTFWSAPLRVAAKLAVAGLETSVRLPAVMAADADVVAPAGAAMLTTPSAAIANPVAARRRKCERDHMILSPCCRNVDCAVVEREPVGCFKQNRKNHLNGVVQAWPDRTSQSGCRAIADLSAVGGLEGVPGGRVDRRRSAVDVAGRDRALVGLEVRLRLRGEARHGRQQQR